MLGFIDRQQTVVVAVAPVKTTSPHTALSLHPDVIIDQLAPDAVAAQVALAKRHALERPASVSSSESPVASARAPTRKQGTSPPAGPLFRILRQALTRIKDGVLIADARQPDLPITYCNRAFEAITGYRENEVLGRNCRFLQGPDTSEDARSTIRNALQQGQRCSTVLKNYRKDGTPFWNEMSIVPIYSDGETLTHFLGIIHDITEHREDQHKLRQSEQRLRQIIDAMPQCIFLKNADGEYLLANDATARLLGTTPDRLEGATDDEFARAEPGRDFRADDQTVIDTGRPKTFTETLKDASGEQRIMRVEMLPFDANREEERLLLVIVTDITMRVQAEEALRQERDLLESIMSTSVAAIAVVDTAGQIVFANERAEDMLSLQPSTAEGRTYAEPEWHFATPDGTPLSTEHRPFQQVCQTGQPVFGAEHAVIWPDGKQRLLSINAAPLKDDTGQVVRVVISIEDITDRKQAERALQVSEERWRRLVRYHPEPILISVNAEIRYINAAGAQAFGAEQPEDIIGQSVLDFVAPEAHDAIEARIDALKQGERTDPFEHRLIRLTGDERIVEAFSVPITYDGQPAAQTVVRDITEKKRAERELKTREQQQAAVAELGLYALEESSLQALMKAVTTRLRDTLQADACHVFELLPTGHVLQERARADGTPSTAAEASTVHVPEDRLAQRTLQSEEPVVFDVENTEALSAPVLGIPDCTRGISTVIQGRNRPYGILSVCTTTPRTFTADDVNFLQTVALLISNAVERKRTEDELQLSEKRYRSVVEQQTELICRFTPDLRLTFVNHAFCTYMDQPVEALVGTDFMERVPDSEHETLRERIVSFSPEQPVQKFELRLLNKHGDVRWFQWAIRAFFDPDQSIAEFQASGRDVTERKILEREVLNASTRERRRIGQDLHDGLGSHLSGVAMLCRGVIRKIEAGKPVEAPIMEEIAQLVDESISQVRKLAHGLNPVKTEEQGLYSALQELTSKAQAHPGVSASFSWDATLPDPESEVATHLYRIAQEAVNNALKHADPSHIRVNLNTRNDKLILVVEDDGTGIPDDVDDQDGMGLRVMNYRANALGAQLRIHPRPETGTHVECILPIGKITQATPSHSPSSQPNGS